MNKYKIEFKQIFKKEVTVFAEDENTAMNIVEQTYLKTDLLDDSDRDLITVETKIIEENNQKIENNISNLEEENIEYLERLADEIKGNLNEMREVLEEIKEENL